jgi:putative effector of murein hydrolase
LFFNVTDRVGHGLGLGTLSMMHATTTAAAINRGTTIAAALSTGNLLLKRRWK